MTESKKQEHIAQPGSGSASHLISRLLSGVSRSKLPDRRAHLIFWSLLVAGLVADLWTKSAVFAWVEEQPNRVICVIDGFLQFVAERNAGAAWGIATGRRGLLITVSVVALVGILLFLLLSGSRDRTVHTAFGLFAAGVCGNLYDRIFEGGTVRDFVDVAVWPGKRWPAFNVADALLCIAVGLMILSSLGVGKRSVSH